MTQSLTNTKPIYRFVAGPPLPENLRFVFQQCQTGDVIQFFGLLHIRGQIPLRDLPSEITVEVVSVWGREHVGSVCTFCFILL